MIDDLKDCYFLTVKDNTMLPTLQPDDKVFFRLESWEPENGEVVVLVDADNHGIVRRYKREKDKEWFVGDSPDTPPLDARDTDMRIGKILQAYRTVYIADQCPGGF